MIDARPVVMTVSQLNSYVKQKLDDDLLLNCVFMTGEISNFTNHYRTGHLYFRLKDESSTVDAVMFKSNADRLRFLPEDGMSVIVRGRVSLFEAQGKYQIYIDDMQPDGVGALTVEFEQTKERLEKEGLFDRSAKKELPLFPKNIGVITSPTGAAVQDIKNILERRFCCASVYLYPAQVQGDNAVAQLINGIEFFNKEKNVDVIIIGRGGGSIEDLWAFNSEALARAIFNCEIPVISAVGHETDFTIADFVADVRAETPSAAAELAVPDKSELLNQLNFLSSKLEASVKNHIISNREQLNFLTSRDCIKDPFTTLNLKKMLLDSVETGMNNLQSMKISVLRNDFSSAVAKLNALSPLNVLARGYSVAYSQGRIVNSTDCLSVGDNIEIDFYKGKSVCEIKEIK